MQPEKNFLDKLLEKPESYRKKVAYVTTAVLGLFIFSAWLMITSQTLKRNSQPAMTTQEEESAQIKKSLPSLQDQSIKTQLQQQQEQNNSGPAEEKPDFKPMER